MTNKNSVTQSVRKRIELKTGRILAGFLFLLFLLAVTSVSSNAQSATKTSSELDTKSPASGVKVTDVSTNNSNIPQVTVTKETQVQNGYPSDPYYNYKGITDQKAAKEAWIADHPEEYIRMTSAPTKDNSVHPDIKIDSRAKGKLE